MKTFSEFLIEAKQYYKWKKAGYERGGYWASLHVEGRESGIVKFFGLDYWKDMTKDFDESAKRAQKARDEFIKVENKKILSVMKNTNSHMMIVSKGGKRVQIGNKIMHLFGQDSVVIRDTTTGQDLYKVDGF